MSGVGVVTCRCGPDDNEPGCAYCMGAQYVLATDLDAAIARAKAAERNAARYIYLKKMWTVALLNGKVAMRNAYGITADSAKGIDAVIDAAIAAQQAEGE